MTRLVILIACILIGISAQSQDKKKVLASASIMADMATQVAGDLLDVDIIVPIGGDPHLYEPTPGDARKVASADLILINGLTFEGWITELIDNSGTKAPVVTITDGINALTSTQYENSADPHAWMDVSKSLTYVDNILKAFKEVDPKNGSMYDLNAFEYKSKLRDLHHYIVKEVEKIPQKNRVIITSHDAFQYYGRAYGLELESIMGVSTDAEAQTSDIIRVSSSIRKHNVPAIFVESTINPKLINQIAEDNNVKIGGSLFADSLGDEESPAPTYYDMMKYDTDVIVKALSATNATSTEDNTEKNSTRVGRMWMLLPLILLIAILFFGLRSRIR